MGMRAVLFAAFFLAACGSRTPLDVAGSSTDTSGGSPTGTPTNCVYGKLGSVRGLPLGLASTGNTVFVVSADVGGVIGDLNAITSDGAIHPVVKGNAFIGMATYASTIAFNRRMFDNEQNLLSATVEIVNSDFSTTQIDSTNTNVAQVDSLATDGTSLYWYRWPPSTDPFDTPNYGTPSIVKYDGGSITSTPLTTVTEQDLVTDGVDSFTASNDISGSGSAEISASPLDGGPTVTLAQLQDDYYFVINVVGVDDTSVVVVTDSKAWTIPKNGGAPTQIVSDMAFDNATVLQNHRLIWNVQNPDGSGSISSVSTAGGAIETVASSTSSIPVLTADACGVVYATTDSSAPGTTAASVYRAKF